MPSALEYLVTHAWVIIILVLVLAVLYYLGFFSAQTPRAEPGACQVLRPNGPGTSQFLALSGLCSGEWPEFVTTFLGTTNSFMDISYNIAYGTNTAAVTAWVDPLVGAPDPYGTKGRYDVYVNGGISYAAGQGIRLSIQNISENEADFAIATYPLSGKNGPAVYVYSPANVIKTGHWYFLVGEYNGTYISIWVNGVFEGRTAISNAIDQETNQETYIAVSSGAQRVAAFPGYIANVQTYNVSLTPKEISALYSEGIGGAPINLQNLVAWWPLNGNGEDYSGNGYNAGPDELYYVSQWSSSYTEP